MKTFERILLLSLLAIAGCTEPFDPGKESVSTRYLVVEATLSDLPVQQTIYLSESIPYSGKDEDRPVSGAIVTVSDASGTVRFSESNETPGKYDAPLDYACLSGKEYTLMISAERDGENQVYVAETEMPELGMNLEMTDYKYSSSSETWLIGVWGAVTTGDYFYVDVLVNGVSTGVSSSADYHNMHGATFGGMCIARLSAEKFNLKTGDVVSLVYYGLTKDYYTFISAYSSAVSGVSTPILADRPSNLPCNIAGDCVLGYFSACPTKILSCVVDDPHRTEYLYECFE